MLRLVACGFGCAHEASRLDAQDGNGVPFRPVVFHYMTQDKQRAVERVMYGSREQC